MAINKIIVNQDFIKQVESMAAEKLRKAQQLSLEDIATLLNVRRMEGMEFAPSQSVRMFSPEFGIFTDQRSIMSAGEMSEYMKAGYIPHASSNANFITVPILPFAIGGESDELFSSFVGAYEVSKSAGMASGAFFIPLGDLRYLPNRFKGEKTSDISTDIRRLINGVEIESIVNPYMFKNRITGQIQQTPNMLIAGDSSRKELMFSSGHWINKGTGKNDASSIRLKLTGYSYINQSGQVEIIDAAKKIRGKYELPDDALPIFDVSITLNNDITVPSYTLDMRQLYDENTKILQAFFNRAEAEKIKASSETIFDTIMHKSARLPDAMFANKISRKSYQGAQILDTDYFVDIETTPNISGKNYITQFGFTHGESFGSISVYTPFSFSGRDSVEEAAALTTKFKNAQLDRITARMLDIIRTGETGEDIINSPEELNKITSQAKRVIGYNLKKFDIPQLTAAGITFEPTSEIVDVYEFISSHKRIIEEYF
uniref:hypothetical protein n=1 Tax=Mesotoga prima TaxID=1184387 RepID=UPI002FDA0DF6